VKVSPIRSLKYHSQRLKNSFSILHRLNSLCYTRRQLAFGTGLARTFIAIGRGMIPLSAGWRVRLSLVRSFRRSVITVSKRQASCEIFTISYWHQWPYVCGATGRVPKRFNLGQFSSEAEAYREGSSGLRLHDGIGSLYVRRNLPLLDTTGTETDCFRTSSLASFGKSCISASIWFPDSLLQTDQMVWNMEMTRLYSTFHAVLRFVLFTRNHQIWRRTSICV
jgi:hypothetical protein